MRGWGLMDDGLRSWIDVAHRPELGPISASKAQKSVQQIKGSKRQYAKRERNKKNKLRTK